jgi:hypothetical protein
MEEEEGPVVPRIRGFDPGPIRADVVPQPDVVWRIVNLDLGLVAGNWVEVGEWGEPQVTIDDEEWI